MYNMNIYVLITWSTNCWLITSVGLSYAEEIFTHDIVQQMGVALIIKMVFKNFSSVKQEITFSAALVDLQD